MTVSKRDGQDTGATFPIVGVGASAGGLDAFTQLLKALPADSGMGFVLIQHLAPSHPSALAAILSRATQMPVLEVRDEPTVKPNHVYVIPPGRCMSIKHGALALEPRESDGHRRVIDHFLRALAEDSHHLAVGVILSGTASDGTLGLEAIRAEGGITFAQDASAQHDGMPTSAIDSGCVDFVLAPDAIARELLRIGKHPHDTPTTASANPNGPDIAQIVQILHHVTGVDFAHYKFNTFYRRVVRRMLLQKKNTLADYAKLLRSDHAEAHALRHDILISVTSFFRNPDAWDALKRDVFPLLLKDRSRHDTMRFWSLGCSTGQEAYSLAIAYTEFCEAMSCSVPLQLFATDLNETAIDKARAGIYPKAIAEELSPERLRRFFVKVDAGYQISKSIRDVCLFSRHNALTDPPFSRIDLLCCRNVLIYLEPFLQQKILPTFHYALKPAGYLWLGSSESVGSHRHLFESQDARHKFYSKKGNASLRPSYFPLQHDAAQKTPVPARAPAEDLPKEVDRILSMRFAPPGVLVSADLEILQYRGDTSPYLAPTPGKASLGLLKMLREGLIVAVRAAIARADQERTTAREDGLRVKSENGFRDVDIEVVPLGSAAASDRHSGFLILFQEADGKKRAAVPAASAPLDAASATSDRERLTQELAATREYLQSVIEQQEASYEELQSASEEAQSANEELQSTNEELETSKEEIQSTNEELLTLNDELNNRNTELNRLNNDLLNVLNSVQMPIVIFGPDLRIRRLTPLAQKLLELDSACVGRTPTDFRFGLDGVQDLHAQLIQTIETAHAQDHEVRDRSGRWHSLRLSPYRTQDNKIDGVVLMLVDIETSKQTELALAHLAAIVTSSGDAIIGKDLNGIITSWNAAAARIFGYSAKETVGKSVTLLMPADRVDEEPEILQRIRRGESVRYYETVRQRKDGSLLDVSLTVSPIHDASGKIVGAAKIVRDVTQEKRAAQALLESELHFRALFESSPFAVYSCDNAGAIQKFNARAVQLWGRVPLPEARYCGSYNLFLPDGTFLPPDRSPMAQVLRGEIASSRDTEMQIERPDGSRITVMVNIVPVEDERGKIIGAIDCFFDITERKQHEEALQRYANELSETDRHKNEFLAMLAHELRNPLAPIRNAIRILQLVDGDKAAGQSALSTLDRQAGQMARLVDDLLDTGRITRGKIGLRRAHEELRVLMKIAVEDFRGAYAHLDRNLEMMLPARPLYAHVDSSRLIQVISNLLSNARKFSRTGGTIALRLEKSGKHAVIRVRDDGIGLAADQIPRIFTLFTQIDTTTERSTGGLGIGLALAKNLVESHGGTIEAHSEGLGHGCEFVICLPTVAASAVPPTAKKKTKPLRGRRILVVDDNRDAADSMAMLLQLTGNETRIAYDGKDAFSQAAKFRPDIMLLDIGLPKLNGNDVARRIRARSWGKNIVLVAITGWGQDEDRQQTVAAGFDGHLVKPVDYATLTQLLATLAPR